MFHLCGKLWAIAQTLFYLVGSFGQFLKPYFISGEASSSCSNPISLRGKLRAIAQFGGAKEVEKYQSFAATVAQAFDEMNETIARRSKK